MPVSIGIKHTRGDTPGQESRRDTHGAAQASQANDRGEIDFGAPIGFIPDIGPISGQYRAICTPIIATVFLSPISGFRSASDLKFL